MRQRLRQPELIRSAQITGDESQRGELEVGSSVLDGPLALQDRNEPQKVAPATADAPLQIFAESSRLIHDLSGLGERLRSLPRQLGHLFVLADDVELRFDALDAGLLLFQGTQPFIARQNYLHRGGFRDETAYQGPGRRRALGTHDVLGQGRPRLCWQGGRPSSNVLGGCDQRVMIELPIIVSGDIGRVNDVQIIVRAQTQVPVALNIPVHAADQQRRQEVVLVAFGDAAGRQVQTNR